MARKRKQLEWYCMEWGVNGKLQFFNVMYAIDIDDLKKKLRYKGTRPNKYNSIKNYNELREYLGREFMYHFWCKCEHEIIVNSWPDHDESTEEKIDVFDQIRPNLDRITEYVIRELKINFQ